MTSEPLEELTLHRLLVAVDGSPGAELALRAAITVARKDHATLTLVAVAPDVGADLSRWSAAVGVAPPSQEQVDEETRQLLCAAVERIPGDLPVRTLQLRGKAGPSIVAHAAESDYDGILMGARGVGRVGALMGSVSAHVMHHAQVPVFVAHPPREPAQGSARSTAEAASP